MRVTLNGMERKTGYEHSKDVAAGLKTTQQVYPTVGTLTSVAGNQTTGERLRRYTGYRIPDFHSRVKRGDLLPHTYFVQVEISASGAGMYETVVWNSSKTARIRTILTAGGYQGWSGLYIPEETLMGLAQLPPQYLIQKAAAEIYEGGYDLLTSLVEIRELPKLFVGTARNLSNYASRAYTHAKNRIRGERLPRLSLKEYWDLSEKYANEWLQGRYGWRTTLYDIDEISKAVANYDVPTRSRIRKKCTDSDSTLSQSVIRQQDYSHVLEQQIWDNIHWGLVGSVVADIKIPKIQVNPVATAWEATKLSFVVDWMVDVGQAISAASFMLLQQGYASSCGASVTVERVALGQAVDFGPLWYSGSVSTSGTCSASYTFRYPSSIPLNPLPRVRLNAAKVADIVALLRQALPKKKR